MAIPLSKRQRRLVIFITASVALLLFFLRFWYYHHEPLVHHEKKMRQFVEVVQAEKAAFVESIEAFGTTKSNESVDVTSNVTDIITAIYFDDGMKVEKGDVLAELARQEELAQLAQARANLTEQKRELERIRDLVASRNIPQARFDERQTQVEVAEFAVKAAESRLADRIIRAPFAGVLGLRDVSVGTLISPGDVITTLDDTRVMKLDFTVPATFLPVIKPGLAIIATTPGLEGREYQGEITTVDPRVDPVSRSITARAELPNPKDELKPGLLMQITLIKDRREALLIPEEALIPFQQKNFVFVVDPEQDNKVIQREVVMGGRKPGVVEIISGIDAGEQVMIRGINRVRPGEHVDISQ